MCALASPLHSPSLCVDGIADKTQIRAVCILIGVAYHEPSSHDSAMQTPQEDVTTCNVRCIQPLSMAHREWAKRLWSGPNRDDSSKMKQNKLCNVQCAHICRRLPSGNRHDCNEENVRREWRGRAANHHVWQRWRPARPSKNLQTNTHTHTKRIHKHHRRARGQAMVEHDSIAARHRRKATRKCAKANIPYRLM